MLVINASLILFNNLGTFPGLSFEEKRKFLLVKTKNL